MTRSSLPRTGLVLDPRYLDHDPGSWHPERPARIECLLDLAGSTDAVPVQPRLATEDDLTLVHTVEYVRHVAGTADREAVSLDWDTTTSPASFETARLATGGFLALLDAIVAGDVDRGLALVRPPGHHAEADRARGFCLFNNVAIGAAHLRRRHGIRRILILDWDVHHGNGTQHAFEEEPDVLFVSLHRYPFFPGSGAAREVGRGPGEGRTVNVPLPAGCGDEEYREAFQRVVDPIVRAFAPELVLVSAGYDAHALDPLGGMAVTMAGFRDMARRALAAAREHAGGRLAAVLEGGYHLGALRENVEALLDEMSHERAPEAGPARSVASPVVDPVREIQADYWPLP